MAYPGLILANAALGEGVETHLFFTFWGFDMITKSRMDDLKFTMLGNTATHMPQGLGGLPGMTAMATHQMKKQIHDIGVPEVPEFLAQIVASGGHLWACRMSADMMHLDENDLYDAVEGIISAADFIEKTDGAQLLLMLEPAPADTACPVRPTWRGGLCLGMSSMGRRAGGDMVSRRTVQALPLACVCSSVAIASVSVRMPVTLDGGGETPDPQRPVGVAARVGWRGRRGRCARRIGADLDDVGVGPPPWQFVGVVLVRADEHDRPILRWDRSSSPYRRVGRRAAANPGCRRAC